MSAEDNTGKRRTLHDRLRPHGRCRQNGFDPERWLMSVRLQAREFELWTAEMKHTRWPVIERVPLLTIHPYHLDM